MSFATLLDELRQHRRVLLLGFGREGRSSLHLLSGQLPELELSVADANPVEDAGHAQVFSGPDYLRSLAGQDLILKAPGVPLKKLGVDPDAHNFSSQSELFLKHFRQEVVGVTGTKGKSTTTTLIHHLLAASGQRAFLAGNIGVPPFDVAAEADGTTVALELSCHQLELSRHSPSVAVLLNLYPEHLDYYQDLESYFDAKLNLVRHQRRGDHLILNLDDPNIQRLLPEGGWSDAQIHAVTKEESSRPGAFLQEGAVFVKGAAKRRRLFALADAPPGLSPVTLMAAALAASLRGVEPEAIAAAVRSFRPLPHRLEKVATLKGVTFYNDSISTVPESAIFALECLGNVGAIILGGFDRGIPYDALAAYLVRSKVENIVLLGETGKRIGAILKRIGSGKTIHAASGLEDAATFALERCPAGSVCLLSPAAPSYGEFKNFEERGERFKTIVGKLANGN